MSKWGALALLALGGCSNLNFAAAMRWNGLVDTDLSFSSFFTNDHTVTFRFMPEYTMVGEAPVLSINGSGTYKVGLSDYRAGGSNAVKLILQVGGSTAFYTQGNPTADGKTIPLKNKWHTVAVVKQGSTFSLFLDGSKLSKDGGGDLTASAADIAAVSGTLRLGREASGDPQYYGLIDDVLVFSKPLSKAQLTTLFGDKRVSSSSVSGLGLVRAYTFDSTLPSGGALPAEFAHAVTITDPAYKALVSQARDNKIDTLMQPPPNQQTAMQLPFASGQIWRVEQGNEGLASHNGTAAFSWDLVRDDPNSALPNTTTCGTEVFAVCDGSMTNGCDFGDPPPSGSGVDLTKGCAKSQSQFTSDGNLIDGYDEADIQDGSDETQTWLHLQKGSLREMFPSNTNFFHSPVVAGPGGTLPITKGQKIARAGTRGANNCHLHYSTEDLAGTTHPVAFDNWQVFDSDAKMWLDSDGIPQFGQFIRRPPKTQKKAQEPAQPNPNPGPENEALCSAARSQLTNAQAERGRLWEKEPDESGAKRSAQLTRNIDSLKHQLTRCR